MKYKIYVLLIVVLLISGCTVTQPIGEDIKTLEQLKQAKASGIPISEFDKCIMEINAEQDRENECVKDYLKAKGYDDELDCIIDFSNPLCEDRERYNAEFKAGIECASQTPENSLSVFDCLSLMEEIE